MKIYFFATVAAFMLILTGWKITERKIAGEYTLEVGAVIQWKGNMPNGSNNGTFDIGSYLIQTDGRKLIGGEFTFPITSIKNLNIPDAAPREQLIHHLLSKDFFDVAVHPTASFRITKVEPFNVNDKDAVAGANHHITGELTLLGKTNEIHFPANVAFAGKQMMIAASFTIDRTRWGMNYASDPAAQMFIEKNVQLSFRLRASKS